MSPLDGLLDPSRSTASCMITKYRRIERLAGCKELAGKARAQPAGAGAGVAPQQQHAVDCLAYWIAPRRSRRTIMQLQLGVSPLRNT
jgi:hypothetical protein